MFASYTAQMAFFPTSYATTGIRIHIGSVAPPYEILIQGAFSTELQWLQCVGVKDTEQQVKKIAYWIFLDLFDFGKLS